MVGDIFTIRADGSGEPEQMTATSAFDTSPQWSADDRCIAYVAAVEPAPDDETPTELVVLDLTTKEAALLTTGEGVHRWPRWRPGSSERPVRTATQVASGFGRWP